jgi:hypothetical protein
MSFKLCSYIEIIHNGVKGIEKFNFRGGINEVVIRRSVNNIVDTATLKMPSLSRIIDSMQGTLTSSNAPQSSVEIAKKLKNGDKITIQLGYNNDLRTEFVGYIKSTIFTTPAIIECVGCAKQLNTKMAKSWKETTVKEVIEFIVQGTDIRISPFVHQQEIPLKNFTINNNTGFEVLTYLKEKLGLTACFMLDQLYVGLQQIPKLGTVKLRLGWNVAREDKLQSSDLSDRPLLIRFKCKDGKAANNKLVYEVGEPGGDLIEEYLPHVANLDTLKRLAEQKFSQRNNPGLGGSLICFMQPFCEPFYTAQIIDKSFNARDGLYFISSTEVTFGMLGGRRKLQLSGKLN